MQNQHIFLTRTQFEADLPLQTSSSEQTNHVFPHFVRFVSARNLTSKGEVSAGLHTS
jgi:hypothetical protein